MNPLRWRLLFILALTMWALYSVAPSILYFTAPKEVRNSDEELSKRIPDWLPQKHVKLGLDLQGGVQLVLGVNTASAVDNKLGRIGVEAQRWADDKKLGVEKIYVLSGKQQLRVEVKPDQDVGAFKEAFSAEFPGLVQASRNGQIIDFVYDDAQIKRIKESAIEQAERVVRNRIDKWGVAEPLISRRKADNSILVQLPGFKDPGKAKELLGRTAQLKFKIVDDTFKGFETISKTLPPNITVGDNGGQMALISEDREALLAFVKPAVPEDKQVFLHREEIAGGKKTRYTTYVVEAATEISGDDIMDAFPSEDTSGLDRRPEVAMRFTGPGGKRFGDVTGENIGKRLAIVLDDIVVSAPNIQSKIATGQGRITMGGGKGYEATMQEANELALVLKSGALPATIEVLEERQVGASLGPELADEGIKGAVVGLVLILAFLLIYYKRPGFIACIAILLNAVYLLALMAAFGFSLSLPGIAGFVLTLGVGVDANVLINERIRQELSEGKNSKKAVEFGFGKVFWTIVDANVTTLIAAIVLLETNASGPIRGFAVTLIIGLIVSMFTSLYCSKSFFELALSKAKSDKDIRKWLGGDAAADIKVFNFDFIKKGKLMSTIGLVVALVTVGTALVRGMNWGVDFAGGTEMVVAFATDTQPDDIDDVAKSAGIKDISLQAMDGGKRQYMLRFGGESGVDATQAAAEAQASRDLRTALLEKLSDKKPEILQVDYVGPQIGKELRKQGIVSMFWAIVGVMLYVMFRFDMRFGPSAIIKMVHDLLVTLAFYVFFWRSFDLTAVAACLTVVGYSVNDVIVIYDRIRENIAAHPKRTTVENVNISLNETLSRSLITSLVTILSLIGLLVFGSGSIWNFAVAMTFGVVVCTFSSTFLSTSLIVWIEAWRKARSGRARSPSATTASART
jgi:protein-export membrane protein SecD/preprotein translocase SecF subunit